MPESPVPVVQGEGEMVTKENRGRTGGEVGKMIKLDIIFSSIYSRLMREVD